MVKSEEEEGVGLEYWLQWHVLVCALIFVVPAVVALILIKKKREPLSSVHLWVPCWRNLNPLWLLFYRAFAFTSMAFLLFQTVSVYGVSVFYFYTQWSFALVMVYFAVGTAISVRGCWRNSYSKKTLPKNGESDEFMKKDLGDSIKLQSYYKQEDCDHKAGFWEYLMQAIYQTSAGAAILTDIVFWCILVPFLLGENFHLTLLIGCMHSLNAVFLLIDSAINSLPFPWYRLTYFVLWSVVYVIFHWLLHAFGFTNWWPYPFLDLSSPWAPLWYLGLGLVHIPCYGLYVLLMRAKNSIFSRMFPSAFGCSFL
ncbi:uncharacterized protein LOC132306110 isoform X1 [Cornus florida]|uniref:uncharacterized protein LOC132306110 isoform X1 n=1 Tax=Cornus florida TaxID=4283 RepID=UPI0028991221|nr:uncharacterized protein LOC132306110 isoform X1 [Cornus florida]